MTKKKASRRLVLDGSELSDDDRLPELVSGFRNSLAESGTSPVILNLSGLRAIYSKGIAVILGVFKDCKAANRDFSITVSSDDTLNLFRMLKLDKVIEIRMVQQ